MSHSSTKPKSLICNREIAHAFSKQIKTETRRLPVAKHSISRYTDGDILWIREPVRIKNVSMDGLDVTFKYLADGEVSTIPVPDRFVCNESYGTEPKWLFAGKGVPNGCLREMARMFYRVESMYYEELQKISLEEIIAEGFTPPSEHCSVSEFAFEWWEKTWNSTAPDGKKWNDNPIVEVYRLTRLSKEDVDA